MDDFVMRARDFAAKAHAGQKYGAEPYTSHLEEVVRILVEFGVTDPTTMVVGYLHDVMEDTDTLPGTLSEAFGYEVGYPVGLCTDKPGPNRKTRKAATYKAVGDHLVLWNQCPTMFGWVARAITVKVADRIANIRASFRERPDLLKMYRKEAATFRTAYYTTGMCDALWAEYDRVMS